MQSLPWLKKSSFLEKGQIPIAKFEVYHDGGWIDLCDLSDENYLEKDSLSISLGGAKMLPTPVAGEWGVTINNPDGIFHPSHPTSSYSDLFEEGKKVRISLGSTFGTYRDDFDTDEIGDEWNIHNTDAGRKIVQAGGNITISVAANIEGRWHSSNNEAPKLYQDVPAPPFEFIAKISAFNAKEDTNCGIFIGHYDAVWHDTPQRAYKFWKVHDSGGYYIDVDRVDPTDQEAGSDNYSSMDEDGELWFKITVDEDEDVRFYVSDDDGDSWYQMKKDGDPGVWSDFFLSDMQIGIFAHAKYNSDGIVAPFEYVELIKEDGHDRYWQRIIGYMEEPSYQEKTRKVNINGYDYMKLLMDTELKKADNEDWGSSETFDSIASGGTLGDELYAELDAMEIGGGEAGNVADWDVYNATFEASTDTGGGSAHVGKINITDEEHYVKNDDVATVEAGKEYKLVFKYRRVHNGNEESNLIGYLRQTIGGSPIIIAYVGELIEESYTEASLFFTARTSGALRFDFAVQSADPIGAEFRVDEISIKEHTDPVVKPPYDMPSTCVGVYYVTLDSVEVFQDAKDGGWFYDADANQFFFDEGKSVEAGSNNLVVYYYIAQTLENVVADLMVNAGLYANQAAALAGMNYTATGISIPKVFFEAGNSYLDSMRLCCERANYRFFFQYDGTPDFNPAPTKKDVGSEDIRLHEGTYSEPSYYRDKSEIWNRVVIEGLEQGQRVGPKEAMTSELRAEENDSTSIAAYGEHTKTIKNHLFQDQTELAAMAVTLLALRKDPKYYFDSTLDYNPLPLEIGDTARQQALLAVGTGEKYKTFVYGDGTLYGGAGIVIVRRGIIRDISISNFDVQYKCEEVT